MAELTIKMLKNAGACAPALKRLKALFGPSVEITEEFCVEQALVGDCDWDWASNLLSPEARAEYDRVVAAAWVEYNRVRDAAWVEYERVWAPAQAEYERVTASTWAEYKRVRASIWTEYKRVRDAAWAKYERVRASTWARLWIRDHAVNVSAR